MDAIRLGLQLRALRIRRRWRQLDVADRCEVSRSTISNLERGRLSSVALGTLLRVASVLGADVDIRLRWRGEQLDRLLDEGHARLVTVMSERFVRLGWQVAVEVTFSIWGERGSIDLLAFHPAQRALLVTEMKTVVPDFQATVAAHDRKTRLARTIANERGWRPTSVSRLLVIERGTTSRDRLARLGAAMDAAYPIRGPGVRAWLGAPVGAISGILFVRSANGRGASSSASSRQRVRRTQRERSATFDRAPRT